MRQCILSIAIATVAFLCGTVSALDDPKFRRDAWLEDINFYSNALTQQHKSFFELVPRARWDSEVMNLKREVPNLSDAAIILRLLRMIAMLHVSHTNLDGHTGVAATALHRYPIDFHWQAEGMVVTGVLSKHREALACRVVRINSLTPGELQKRLEPWICYDNQVHLQMGTTSAVRLIELMKQEHLADVNGHLQVTCARNDGSTFTIDVPDIEHRSLLSVRESLKLPPTFAAKNAKDSYWFEYLPGFQTLYISIRNSDDMSSYPLRQFIYDAMKVADSHPTQRLILDIRLKSGGNSAASKLLIDQLRIRPRLIERGRFFVLIGEHTYSAGVNWATALLVELHPVFVGQPSGGRPVHYGNIAVYYLPNSKIKFKVSKTLVGKRKLLNNLDSLPPDIPVPLTIADMMAGRDATLETALRAQLP